MTRFDFFCTNDGVPLGLINLGRRRVFGIAMLALVIGMTLVPQGDASASHTPAVAAGKTAVVAELLGTGLTAPTTVSSTYTGNAAGMDTFSTTYGSHPIGFNNGAILSSGNVTGVVGPNNIGDLGVNLGVPGDSDLTGLTTVSTYDASVLEIAFEFNTLPGTPVSFTYVFASEEYEEYVNAGYNDLFGFFLNGVNIATLPVTSNPPVTIDIVNHLVNSSFYVDNSPAALDLQPDGFTTQLVAQGILVAGVNTLKIGIADAGDSDYDSWVMLKGGSFNCGPPIPNNAKPTFAPLTSATANEGSIATNSGTFSDPDTGDVATVTASFGTVTQVGTWNWSFLTSDGPT